jgi:hypothetical protein
LVSLLAFIALAFGALAVGARAEAPLSLRIEAADPLGVGTTAHADVFVRVPDASQPLLLTPSIEGDAVRVVRGRLLRADAQPAQDGELRFEVPLVVSSAGSAVLRAEVLTYRCAPKCEALRASGTRLLHAELP